MLMIFLNPRGAGLVVLPTLYRWFDEKPAEA
jgi:hypothetical protein